MELEYSREGNYFFFFFTIQFNIIVFYLLLLWHIPRIFLLFFLDYVYVIGANILLECHQDTR